MGLSALVRVHNGSGTYSQYIDQPLPGFGAAGAGGASEDDAALTVNYDTTPGWVYQGQSNGKFGGSLSTDAVAIAIAVPDAADGYWVKPAGTEDPSTDLLTWTAYLDVSEDVEAGYHDVSFVAIGESGQAGAIITYPLCVRSRVPDNFNACQPSSDAPNAVISLRWDTNVDLDLQIVDSDGNVTDAKNPTTLPTGDEVSDESGVLDRDSNAGCVIDGVRYENLVWNASIPSGKYGMYVNLFDACGKASAHFEVSVYVAEPVDGAGQKLRKVYSQSGVLMDFQANGGESRGLFIAEYEF